MFHGSIVALVTPMNPDGSIDFASYLKLLEFHINNNSDGVVVIGTTGEAPTIDFDEHVTLIQEAVNFVDGKIPVIAGTGANSTKEANLINCSLNSFISELKPPRICCKATFCEIAELLAITSATASA